MNAQHVHAAYREGQVSASNPVRIVVLLYEGAIRFTRQGMERFEDTAIRGQALGRAHAIVSELQAALDLDGGGAIAGNLDRLYRYSLEALIRANTEGERKALDSVVDVLETLASGWREVERVHRTAAP